MKREIYRFSKWCGLIILIAYTAFFIILGCGKKDASTSPTIALENFFNAINNRNYNEAVKYIPLKFYAEVNKRSLYPVDEKLMTQGLANEFAGCNIKVKVISQTINGNEAKVLADLTITSTDSQQRNSSEGNINSKVYFHMIKENEIWKIDTRLGSNEHLEFVTEPVSSGQQK